MVFGSCVFPAQGKSDNSLEKSDFSAGANDGSAYGFHEPYYKVTKSARKIAVFQFFSRNLPPCAKKTDRAYHYERSVMFQNYF